MLEELVGKLYAIVLKEDLKSGGEKPDVKTKILMIYYHYYYLVF